MSVMDVYRKIPKPVKTVSIALAFALSFRALVAAPYKIPTGSMIPTLKIGDFIFVNKLAYAINFDNPILNLLGRSFESYHVELVRYATPKRGDIIVFAFPNDPERYDYIKRVVAIEGDRVDLRQDHLYINGQPVSKRPFENKDILSDMRDEEIYFSELYIENLLGLQHMIREVPFKQQGRSGICPDQAVRPGADHDCDPYNPGPFTIQPGHVFVMGDNRDDSLDSRFWGEVPLTYVRGKASLVWLSFNPKSAFLRLGGIALGKPRFERFGMRTQ